MSESQQWQEVYERACDDINYLRTEVARLEQENAKYKQTFQYFQELFEHAPKDCGEQIMFDIFTAIKKVEDALNK